MWEWFPGYLTPLWFLAVYGLLIAAVPVTATLHARYGARVLVALAGLTMAAGYPHSMVAMAPGSLGVLAVLVAMFARVELAARPPRGMTARRARHSRPPTG